MALADILVRQARATGKDYTLGDLDGFSLSVSAQGGKTWHFRYYWLGKQKRMSFGIYPGVGLRDAPRSPTPSLRHCSARCAAIHATPIQSGILRRRLTAPRRMTKVLESIRAS